MRMDAIKHGALTNHKPELDKTFYFIVIVLALFPPPFLPCTLHLTPYTLLRFLWGSFSDLFCFVFLCMTRVATTKPRVLSGVSPG